jgi:hypothetical protein
LESFTRVERRLLPRIDEARDRLKAATRPTAEIGDVASVAERAWMGAEIEVKRQILAAVAGLALHPTPIQAGRAELVGGLNVADRISWRWLIGRGDAEPMIAQAHLYMTIGIANVLVEIQRTGPLTQADLDASIGDIHKVIDRLVERGWLRRDPGPSRVGTGMRGPSPRLIAITDAGCQALVDVGVADGIDPTAVPSRADAHIDRIVAAAPDLTDDQVAELRPLFAPLTSP